MREMNWLWRLGAPLVRGIMAICFRVRVCGAEHVPAAGPMILACDHISVLDGPVLAAVTATACRRATRFLVAAEVWRAPIGWILRTAGQIPIRRGAGDVAALDDAVEAVRTGGCAGIFPEGRVNAEPWTGPQRMRSGVARVAMPTGARVVPVGLWGTHEVWPRGHLNLGSLLRRPRVSVVFGEPIEPVGDPEDRDDVTAFLVKVGDALTSQMAAARTLAESTT